MARKRKEDLAREAAEFFRKGGVTLASMEDIAAGLGVARSALYHHFGSRQGLVYDILTRNLQLVHERVADIRDYPLDPPDRLALMIRAVVQMEAEHPSLGLAAVFRLDPGLLSDEQRAAHVTARDAYEELFRSLIREGISSGRFRPVDARIVAFGILAMLTEFVAWYEPSGPLTPAEIAAHYSGLVLGGLRAEQPVAVPAG
jgi:AcrR family transcriptional regulator